MNLYDLKFDSAEWAAVSALNEIHLDVKELAVTEIANQSFLSFDICFSDDTRLIISKNQENIDSTKQFLAHVKKSYVSVSQFNKMMGEKDRQ